MKRFVLATVAASFTALQPMVVPTAVVAVATFVATDTASACVITDVNCKQPTGVGKGNKVPIWHVVDCVIGPEGGPYTPIACDDPRAVHISPRGDEVVCFLGSDNKIHWDFVGWVRKGRKFINQCVANCGTAAADWQPNWK